MLLNISRKSICLAICALLSSVSAMALPVTFYSASSALKEGHWVKIRVGAEGIYQISYDQLRQWGFSDPSNVSVYGYGGAWLSPQTYSTSLPDDLPRLFTYHNSELSKLYFYGEGASRTMGTAGRSYNYLRNYYSDYGYYLLSDCDHGVIPAENSLQIDPTHRRTLTSYSATVVENEVQNPVGMGVFFHDQILEPGKTQSFTFNVRDYDASELDSAVVMRYVVNACGYNDTRLGVKYPTELNMLALNEVNVNRLTPGSRQYNTGEGYFFGYPTGKMLRDAPLTFTFDNATTTSSSQLYCALDKIGIVYPRLNRMSDDGSQLILDRPDTDFNTDFVITNASPATVVMDCTLPWEVRLQQTYFESEDRTLTGTYGVTTSLNDRYPTRLVAFDPTSATECYEPEYVGPVSNQNIHGADVPEMLIVTTDNLLEAARELADIHRAHGLTCLVVTQSQVFNEFSSGTPMPFAIQRCAKMFYDRNPMRFRHVLLYGAGTWDPRGIATPQNEERLLTYQCEHTYYGADINTCYTHDGYFGMLEDTFNPQQVMSTFHNVSVGRIPAKDLSKGRAYNAKVASYLENPPSLDNYLRAVMISDDGNVSKHLSHSTSAMVNMRNIRPSMTFIQAHNMLFPWTGTEAAEARRLVSRTLSNGAGLYCFSGHGSAAGLTNERLWDRPAISNNSYSVFPMAILATCDTYAFDKTTEDFVHDLAFKSDGGAIGIVAAGRSVYMDINQELNLTMVKAYAGASHSATIGDIYRNGHNCFLEQKFPQNYNVNTMCYNLCGDPAVPVSAPDRHIAFDKLDGVDISECIPGAIPQQVISSVPALRTTRISGFITNGTTPVSDFNGTATLTVYESPRIVSTILQSEEDKRYDDPRDVEIDQTVLATFSAPVVDGKFEIPFTLPEPGTIGAYNRFVVVAETADKAHSASSVHTYSVVTEADSDAEPSAPGPEFTELYVDTPEFSNGDIVGADPVLYGSISCSELGLMLSDALGAAPVIRIDSRTTLTNPRSYFSADPSNTSGYRLELPLTGLAPGYHNVSVSVSDNARQTTEASVSFYINPSLLQGTLSIAGTADPSDRSSLSFELENPLGSGQTRLFIADALGRTVLTVDNPSFPYVWNFSDAEGNKVADGHYSAWAVVSDGTRHASTPRIEVPVVK